MNSFSACPPSRRFWPWDQESWLQRSIAASGATWDGYPLAREVLLASVAAMRKKRVVLAGDTHNAWHSDLTLAVISNPAQAKQKVGEEFATSSVTSPGFEAYLPIPSAQVKTIFESVVDDLNWIDPSRRRFLKMTFTKAQAKGECIFFNTVASRNYEVTPSVPAETRVFNGSATAALADSSPQVLPEPAVAC